MFARFSSVAGEGGAADAERDIRGFALKFYTEEGNWDLVGNNTPVFFHRDPKHFIDLNRAIKRDPRTNMRSPNNNWGFWTSLPESLHQVTITMSDRGLPSSYRFMHGFSSHAYSMINADNERVWVKFYFRSQQGIQNLTDQEAETVNANTRESYQADLYNAIEQGKYPKWKMYIQVMTQEEANQLDYNSYGNYTDHKFMEEPAMQGGNVKNYDFREDDHDYYTQPGMLFRRMTKEQQLVLFENTARNMGNSTLQIKHRHINNCYQADPNYGEGVAKALGINLKDVDLAPTSRDSEKTNEEANARGYEDLNVPSEPAMPETAKDLGPEGRNRT